MMSIKLCEALVSDIFSNNINYLKKVTMTTILLTPKLTKVNVSKWKIPEI